MSVSSVVGIDVAKAHVDVFVLGAEFKAQRFVNEAEAAGNWLLPGICRRATWMQSQAGCRVVAGGHR